MIEKIINRNIGKSQKCRVKYGNNSEFDLLIVNINDGERVRKFSIEAKHLSSEKDSIYFYPETKNDVVTIRWNHEIENYITKYNRLRTFVVKLLYYVMNDFEEYIRQGEPQKREKGYAWQTAIGLQAVDALKPSEYLIQTARQHIEGDITIEEAKQLIDSYYQSKTVRADIEDRTEEADKVSARIAEILSEKTFTFSPVEYITIHRRLFQGIYKFAGKVRDYNITKKEGLLKGETVLYASADSIRETLDFDFMQEKNFSYKDLNINDAITHIAKFISGVWQIHAFGEGNTRTTAVFTIKYLRTFGFDISNEAFANHSWYFRNALVRANYNNLSKGIYATTEYIEAFFRNLILSEHNELKNRAMLVQELSAQDIQSANTIKEVSPKCNICTLNCTLEEIAVLNFLREQPKATQKEIAAHIGKSERTVKTITVNLTEKGIIERKNGKRNGFWEIITNDLNS